MRLRVPAETVIQSLPLPPPPPHSLALPLDADSILRVSRGDKVASGDVLAEGVRGADILAPLAGTVAAIETCPLSHGGSAPCVRVSVQLNAPPDVSSTLLPADLPLPQLLKRAGIIGLGGAAFPAWRKWRKTLHWFVANGVESDPDSRHDAALIRAAGDTLPPTVAAVADSFGARPLLALPDDITPPHGAMIRRVPRRYALGQEKLLLRQLCQLDIPPSAVAADYGAVCFNIATVLAMADALTRRMPLLSRVISIHGGGAPDEVALLRLPFGTSVGAVRAALGIAPPPASTTTLVDECIISARTTVLYLQPPPAPAAALPCIRCGACDSVCPVALSPQRLYRWVQDERLDDMRRERLDDCLACRLCDEVCPSQIPLTRHLLDGKQRLAAADIQQQQQDTRRLRFVRHQERLAQKPRRLAAAELQRQVAAAVDKAKT